MKPSSSVVIPSVLGHYTAYMQGETDPRKIEPLYLMSIVFQILGRDWDNAAANRVEEIKAVSTLLERGAAIAPAALSQSVRETVEKAPDPVLDLRISALNKMLDGLLERLIELHAWVEAQSTSEGKELCKAIWAFLEYRAKRRHVPGCFWF
jgi:hypothetical protein